MEESTQQTGEGATIQQAKPEGVTFTRKEASTGRPSKFNTIDWDNVKAMFEAGLSDKQVASVLKITEETLNNWKNENEDFFKSLKEWKLKSDEKVVRSLFERATGYSHPEEKIFQEKGEIIRANTIKHYPPDALSMIFWLKNRQPELWRDRQEVEFTKPLLVELIDYTGNKRIEAPAAEEASYKEIPNPEPVRTSGAAQAPGNEQENTPKV